MGNDLVTIIIPIYNVEKFLKKCIDSAINQTYTNLEIILVDDGSPDNSGKICDEYKKTDTRIKVIHKKNGGLSDARNCGLELANGKYIFLLDSDDFIEKDTIEYLYKLAKSYQADLVIGKEKLIYQNSKIMKDNDNIDELIESFEPKDALEIMLYNSKFTNMGCNKLYNSRLFRDIRFPYGKLQEDLGTTYKLILKSNKIVFSNKYTYNYFVARNDSIMNDQFNIKRMDGLTFAEEILEYVTTFLPEMKDAAIIKTTKE